MELTPTRLARAHENESAPRLEPVLRTTAYGADKCAHAAAEPNLRRLEPTVALPDRLDHFRRPQSAEPLQCARSAEDPVASCKVHSRRRS